MLLVTPIKDRLGLNAERFTTPPVWTEQALPYDGTYRCELICTSHRLIAEFSLRICLEILPLHQPVTPFS